MRVHPMILAAALVLPLAAAATASPKPKLTGEEKIAKAIEGRVAGKPVKCLMLHSIRSSQIIDRTAILYTTGNGTIYVNRPPVGASSLDSSDILVTRTSTSQLCNIDIVRLMDSTTRSETGFVGLGDFVPYAKVKKAS